MKDLKTAIEVAKEASGERKAFEKRLVGVKEKLRSLSGSLPQESSHEPLLSSDVEAKIADNNVIIFTVCN